MKVYRYPSDEELDELLKRPVRDAADLNATVAAVLDDVRQRGDAAVREYEARFDHVRLDALAVTPEEMAEVLTEMAMLDGEDITAQVKEAWDFLVEHAFVM